MQVPSPSLKGSAPQTEPTMRTNMLRTNKYFPRLQKKKAGNSAGTVVVEMVLLWPRGPRSLSDAEEQLGSHGEPSLSVRVTCWGNGGLWEGRHSPPASGAARCSAHKGAVLISPTRRVAHPHAGVLAVKLPDLRVAGAVWVKAALSANQTEDGPPNTVPHSLEVLCGKHQQDPRGQPGPPAGGVFHA